MKNKDFEEREKIVKKIMRHVTSIVETNDRFYHIDYKNNTIHTEIKEGAEGRKSKKTYKNKTKLERRLKELLRMDVLNVTFLGLGAPEQESNKEPKLFDDIKPEQTKKTKLDEWIEMKEVVINKINDLHNDLAMIDKNIDILSSATKCNLDELREKYSN